MAPAASSGSFLTRKVGGVPVWGLGLVVVGVVGYAWWRQKKNAAASAAAAATTSAAGTGTTAATPAVVPASDYGAPTGFNLAGGGGLPPWLQVPPSVATPPAPTPTAANNQSMLGSGYGILNSQFPTQGVLSVPTAQGTFTELNTSPAGNPFGGQQVSSVGPGDYYQPQPGVFTPITAGDTLSPGTPIFALTPSQAQAA